jgi:hypothetical protein
LKDDTWQGNYGHILSTWAFLKLFGSLRGWNRSVGSLWG